MLAPTGDRMLVHLSGFSRFAEEIDCPAEVTQDGIARAVGISRAHAALEVKRLGGLGRVLQRLAHVRGSRNRRKVYFLTGAGLARVAELRERAFRRRTTMVYPDGDRRDLPGADASRALVAAGLREHQALLRLLESDVVAVHGGTGIPRPPDRLFGRAEELDRLRRFLAGPPGTLVLEGPAGIGKTSVAAAAVALHAGPSLWLAARDSACEPLVDLLAAYLDGRGRPALARCARRGDYGANAIEAVRRDAQRLAVVLDDADSSAESAAFARQCVAAGADVRFLFVSLGGTPGERLTLGPLSRGAARDLLISSRRGVVSYREGEILDACGGNPFLLHLAGRVLGPGDPLESALRTLSARERESLEFAAVFDSTFPAEALPRSFVALRAMEDRGLVRCGPSGYAIPGIVRERVLAGLDRGRRLALHSAAAAYYAQDGEVLQETAHLLRAQRPEEAARRLVEEGARLLRLRKGPTLADKLAAAVRGGASGEGEAILLAEALAGMGALPSARERAGALVGSRDARIRARAYLVLGTTSLHLGDAVGATEAFSQARRVAGRADDLEAEARACEGLAGAQCLAADPHGAVELFATAGRLFAAAGKREEVARLRVPHARALAATGDASAAAALLRPLLARQGDDGILAAICLAEIEGIGHERALALAEAHGFFDVPVAAPAEAEDWGPEAPRPEPGSYGGEEFTAAQ
jgi:hypothetical protein